MLVCSFLSQDKNDILSDINECAKISSTVFKTLNLLRMFIVIKFVNSVKFYLQSIINHPSMS